MVATAKEAEAIVARRLAQGSVVDPSLTIEHAVGWAIHTKRADGALTFGSGPTIVTRRGEVFLCGSMSPTEVHLEDVAVITGAGASLGAKLRHRWRAFAGRVAVSRAV